MPNFYTNVKSRLNKKGIKGLTKTDFLVAAEELDISDLDNATTEQIIAGVDYFVSKQSSQLTTAKDVNNLPVATNATEKNYVNTMYIDVNSIDNDELTDTQDVPENTAIAIADKSELVARTANDMGISLSVEEVTAIAENFDYASQDSDFQISEIESAITAFVHHKAQVTRQKITNMVGNVKATVTRLDNENSQLLNDGLREINNDIKSGSHRFKNQVRTALKVFALPPSKAG